MGSVRHCLLANRAGRSTTASPFLFPSRPRLQRTCLLAKSLVARHLKVGGRDRNNAWLTAAVVLDDDDDDLIPVATMPAVTNTRQAGQSAPKRKAHEHRHPSIQHEDAYDEEAMLNLAIAQSLEQNGSSPPSASQVQVMSDEEYARRLQEEFEGEREREEARHRQRQHQRPPYQQFYGGETEDDGGYEAYSSSHMAPHMMGMPIFNPAALHSGRGPRTRGRGRGLDARILAGLPPGLALLLGSQFGIGQGDDGDEAEQESYEALLELDKQNVVVGVSKRRLDEVSVVQTLDEKSTEKLSDATCAICLDAFEVGQKVRRPQCLCVFHKACVDKHFESSKLCPTCRRDVTE